MENINFNDEKRLKIISDFDIFLQNINSEKDIKAIASITYKLYCSYKDFILPDLIDKIYQNAFNTRKIEYLYLIIEIIRVFDSNKGIVDERKKFFDWFKNIFRCYYYSFKKEFIELKNILNDFKQTKIYSNELIDELIMELRLTTEPKLEGNDDDKKALCELANKNILEIDEDLIDYYKKVDIYQRNKSQTNQDNLINFENELIEKQLKLYNENIKQIKYINELIGYCDSYKNNIINHK